MSFAPGCVCRIGLSVVSQPAANLKRNPLSMPGARPTLVTPHLPALSPLSPDPVVDAQALAPRVHQSDDVGVLLGAQHNEPGAFSTKTALQQMSEESMQDCWGPSWTHP